MEWRRPFRCQCHSYPDRAVLWYIWFGLKNSTKLCNLGYLILACIYMMWMVFQKQWSIGNNLNLRTAWNSYFLPMVTSFRPNPQEILFIAFIGERSSDYVIPCACLVVRGRSSSLLFYSFLVHKINLSFNTAPSALEIWRGREMREKNGLSWVVLYTLQFPWLASRCSRIEMSYLSWDATQPLRNMPILGIPHVAPNNSRITMGRGIRGAVWHPEEGGWRKGSEIMRPLLHNIKRNIISYWRHHEAWNALKNALPLPPL